MTKAPLTIQRWRGAARARAGLTAAFEAHQSRHPGSSLGVGGSWAGPKTLFDAPGTASLAKWLLSALPDGPLSIDGWGVLHQPGDALAAHDHVRSHHGGNNLWAGVYWLDGGSDDDRFCYRMGDDVFEVAPVPGAALVFAADVVHWTHSAAVPRRSIAFNIRGES